MGRSLEEIYEDLVETPRVLMTDFEERRLGPTSVDEHEAIAFSFTYRQGIFDIYTEGTLVAVGTDYYYIEYTAEQGKQEQFRFGLDLVLRTIRFDA